MDEIKPNQALDRLRENISKIKTTSSSGSRPLKLQKYNTISEFEGLSERIGIIMETMDNINNIFEEIVKENAEEVKKQEVQFSAWNDILFNLSEQMEKFREVYQDYGDNQIEAMQDISENINKVGEKIKDLENKLGENTKKISEITLDIIDMKMYAKQIKDLRENLKDIQDLKDTVLTFEENLKDTKKRIDQIINPELSEDDLFGIELCIHELNKQNIKGEK